jgi:hypothetical protein
VPVREIARLAGVNERTLYKYVEKHRWKKRYRVLPRGEAAARADSGRRWRHDEAFAPAKNAGGRFVRREDKAKPFATGLKALDPGGRARALADCAAAEPLSRAAQTRAHEEMRLVERLRAMAELKRYRERCAEDRAAQRPPGPMTRGWSVRSNSRCGWRRSGGCRCREAVACPGRGAARSAAAQTRDPAFLFIKETGAPASLALALHRVRGTAPSHRVRGTPPA